ncbi:MAG: VCBS repeat-containing protein, partial [Planctomycetota bacterium]
GILGHHGVAVADVNGDGIEDLYFCQPGGVPNQLWLRRPDGTAIEVASQLGLALVDATMSALFIDLDGDRDRDAVIGLASEVLVYAMTPEGYRLAFRQELSSVTSLTAADVDGDGRIDVFACAYAQPYDGVAFPNPYHDAENGEPNMLLANVTQAPDELRFVDGTEASGLDVSASRFSIAATFEDADEDGDIDLYIANDFGRNAYYFNDGTGRFTNRAAELGVEDVGAGMAAAFADIDGDGFVDLYVGNMESSAGRRVTGQERFRSDVDAGTRALFRRHSKGNTLYLGDGTGALRETGLATAGHWAWGAIPIDLDGNGALDLFVPNGFVTGTDANAPDL